MKWIRSSEMYESSNRPETEVSCPQAAGLLSPDGATVTDAQPPWGRAASAQTVGFLPGDGPPAGSRQARWQRASRRPAGLPAAQGGGELWGHVLTKLHPCTGLAPGLASSSPCTVVLDLVVKTTACRLHDVTQNHCSHRDGCLHGCALQLSEARPCRGQAGRASCGPQAHG